MSLQQRGGASTKLGRSLRKQPVPPAIDFDRLAKLFSDEHTSGLVERQASELRRAAASVAAAGGLAVSSLPALCSILASVQDRVPTHSDLLAESTVQLMQFVARPFLSRKANEGANNPEAVNAALSQIASLLLCDEPMLSMAAGNTLTHFAQATHTEGLPNGSSWAQNQAMLRSAKVLPTIVDAFHAEVGALLALDVDGDGYIDETEFQLQRNLESGTSARSPSARQSAGSARGDSGAGGPQAANGSNIEQKSAEERGSHNYEPRAKFDDESSDDEKDAFGATTGTFGADSFRRDAGCDTLALAATGATAATTAGFKSTVFLEVLTHLVQCLSMHSENARALIRSGAADALVTLLDVVQSPRQPVVAHVVETLWNLCEHSAAALYEGDVALSLKSLLRKHRTENACYLLSTVQVFEVFGALFRRLLSAPATAFVRSLRNDVLVVATLVARSPSLPPLPPPTGLGAHTQAAAADGAQHSSQGAVILGGGGLMLESGLLHEVLLYSTACEMGLPTEAPFRAFGTAQEGDMQMKTLLWDLVLVSVLSEQEAAEGAAQAKRELHRRQQLLALKKGGGSTMGGGGLGGDGAGSAGGEFAQLPVLQEVKSSLFIHALLCYLDPAQEQHPYLRAWTPAQRRALELQALSLLLALAPRCLAEFGEAGGPTVVLLYLRKHAGMLSVKQLEGGGRAHMEGGAGGVDAALSTPFAPADVQDLADGEDDGDRVYLALRLLTVTCGAGAEGGSKWDEGGVSHGSDFAAAVGELGGVQDIVALLRAVAPAADALVGASAEGGLSADLPAGTPPGLGLGVFKGGKLATPAGSSVSVQLLAQSASVASGTNTLDGTNGVQGGSSASLGVVASIGGCSTPPAHIVEAALTALACLCRAPVTAEAHLTPPPQRSEGGGDEQEDAAVAEAVAAATAAAEDAATVASLNKDRLRQSGGVGVLLTWLQASIRKGGKGGSKSMGQQPARAPGAPPLDPHAGTVTLSRGGTRAISVVDAVTQSAAGHADELARSTAIKASVTAAVAATQGVGSTDGGGGGAAEGGAGGEQGPGAGRAQVAAAVVAALWCGVQGSADGVAQMLAVGGVGALLDLLEVCSVAEASQVLGVLADVLAHPSAGEYLRAWRSRLTGVSAVGLILRTWAEEESRLGVRRGAFGELPETPLTAGGSAANAAAGGVSSDVQGGSMATLGGSSIADSAAQPAAAAPAGGAGNSHLHELLRWVQFPQGDRRPLDSKILSDGVVPPGTTPGAVLGSTGGFNPNTMLGTRKAPRGGGARNAFGRLTEALRAGKMWDMASGGAAKATSRGPSTARSANLGVDSAAESTLDLRGKLFGVLSGAGLDDLRGGSAGDFKCVSRDAAAGCTFEVAARYGELVRGQAWDRVASALQGQAESVSSIAGPSVASVPPHSVSLQPCVRGVPLAPTVPITSDARELMGKLDEHANVLQNTRARQRSLAAEAHAGQAAAEEATLASVAAQRRADEKNATLAVRTRLRRARCPGDMFGLGIAERKAARSGMQDMLAQSRRAGEAGSAAGSGVPGEAASSAAPARTTSHVRSSAAMSGTGAGEGGEGGLDVFDSKQDSDADTSDEEAGDLWLGGAPVDPTM